LGAPIFVIGKTPVPTGQHTYILGVPRRVNCSNVCSEQTITSIQRTARIYSRSIYESCPWLWGTEVAAVRRAQCGINFHSFMLQSAMPRWTLC